MESVEYCRTRFLKDINHWKKSRSLREELGLPRAERGRYYELMERKKSDKNRNCQKLDQEMMQEQRKKEEQRAHVQSQAEQDEQDGKIMQAEISQLLYRQRTEWRELLIRQSEHKIETGLASPRYEAEAGALYLAQLKILAFQSREFLNSTAHWHIIGDAEAKMLEHMNPQADPCFVDRRILLLI